VERVSVVGCSGAGKTTLGRRLAGILDVPFVELDGLVHQPGWAQLPVDEFRAEVRRSCAGDRWVVDGNYRSMVQDLVWDRADTVVWLDLPRWRVMGRVVSRTLRRGVTRQELWNGNREQLRNLLSRDPERSIVLWTLTRHRKYHERYAAAAADPDLAHLRFVRLGSAAEVRRFLATVAAPVRPA
jgi:adenylate kinase family enzyme